MYPRIANDNNRFLVAMLKDLTAPQTAITYPCVITREFYGKVRASYYAQDGHYLDSLIGWVGFMASYGGRFFDGGYSGRDGNSALSFSNMPPVEVDSRVHYIYSTAPEEDYGCQRQEWKRKRDDGVAGFLGKQAITGT